MLIKIWFLLRSRLTLRGTALFSLVGTVLSFVSDVLAVFGPILTWLLVVTAVLLMTAMVFNMVLLASRRAAEVRHPLPPPLPLTADATLFLSITFLLSLGTFVGQAVTRPTTAGQGADAQGLFATLIPAINGVQKSLGGVERDLDDIKGTLRNVKRETSDDPRKELANLGVAWSGDNFLSAVKEGDTRVVQLFLAGGIQPATAESQGRPLPIMLALNRANPDVVLDMLVRAGLTPDQQYPVSRGMGATTTTVIASAIERGNVSLVRALVRHRADLNQSIATVAAMGMTKETFPLAAAVYWKQFEIAGILLDAGADKSVGDYAAYRELRAALARPGGSPDRGKLEALSARMAPTNGDYKRVSLELRLEELHRDLNATALASLRAMPGSSERMQYDRRYNELQRERAEVRAALGMEPQ